MPSNVVRGTVHKFGDDINTDLISPAQYMELSNEGMIAHAMEGADPDFQKKVKKGDIIVAGKNFGPGSSRETAPMVIKGSGVSVVIAEFFARIFYRNSINIGLPVLILPSTAEIADGDELEVDLSAGTIDDITTGKRYTCPPLPENILEIIDAGGLMPQLEKKLLKEEK